MRYIHTLILSLAMIMLATTCAFAQKDIKDMTDEEFEEAVALQKEMNAKGNMGGIKLFGKGAWWEPKGDKDWKPVGEQAKKLFARKGTVLGPKAYAKMKEWKGRTIDMSLLRDVNEYWNHSVEFIFDRDYAKTSNPRYNEWIGPWELERRGKGDCEDYSLGKYFMLKELGFDPHNMRILSSHSMEYSWHATLLVLLDEQFYVLDNETDKIVTIDDFPLNLGAHTTNEFGLWAHAMQLANSEERRLNTYYYSKRQPKKKREIK